MDFRVAYISYADYGGPLIHTREFVKAFRKLVPNLVIYCPFFNKNISYGHPGPETFFNKLFFYFPFWARQIKLEFYQLRKLLRDMAKWRQFVRLYQQHGVDIIVIRNDAYVMAPIYAANKKGIPYLLETNGILSKDKPDRITRLFEKYVLLNAAGIFAVSDPLAELLFSSGVPKKKIRVIPNGVRLHAFETHERSVIPVHLLRKLRGKIVIGYVGTFTVNHDVSSVVSGFAQALLSIPNLCLLLIGEGRLVQHTKEEVRNLGITNEVIFVGKVPHDYISAYIQLCHIMVNPMRQVYKESFVGVPIKMFEYMAAKRPIISTDMPNLRQLLKDSAIFVPPGNAEKWGEAFLMLARDGELRDKKGKQAFELLKKHNYTWEENARKVYEYCSEILTTSARSQ